MNYLETHNFLKSIIAKTISALRNYRTTEVFLIRTTLFIDNYGDSTIAEKTIYETTKSLSIAQKIKNKRKEDFLNAEFVQPFSTISDDFYVKLEKEEVKSKLFVTIEIVVATNYKDYA